MSKIRDICIANPVDIVAARVTWPGVHYEPEMNLNQELWTDAPPLTMTPPLRDDLVGTSRGRITIFGYLNPKQLVGRCVCGNYVRRRANNWRRGLKTNADDYGCYLCLKMRSLKNSDHFRRHGRGIDQ